MTAIYVVVVFFVIIGVWLMARSLPKMGRRPVSEGKKYRELYFLGKYVAAGAISFFLADLSGYLATTKIFGMSEYHYGYFAGFWIVMLGAVILLYNIYQTSAFRSVGLNPRGMTA